MTYETPIGANMFAYCLNNPAKMTDDGGEWAHIAAGALIGAVVNVAMGYLSAVQDGRNYSVTEGVIDAASGAISGGLAASGAGRFVQTAVNAAVAGFSTVSKNYYEHGKVNGKEVASSVVCGALSGAIGGDGLTLKSGVKKHVGVMNRHLSSAATSAYTGLPNGGAKCFWGSYSLIKSEMRVAQTNYMLGVGASYVTGNIFSHLNN